MITVYVAYATPERQVEIPLSVEANCTVALAIKRSGILDEFEELNIAELAVGIFSKRVALDAALQDGDRIEIYRPLIIDPKHARRLRAKKKNQQK